jgi:predicted O-linked N-acetylglucosamine transferase (SPINDLY family)
VVAVGEDVTAGDANLFASEADALQSAGKVDAAIAAYRQALQLDTGLFDAWYGLGCCYLASRSYGAAADALGKALALRADAAEVRCNLAEALFQLGAVDAAARHYIVIIEKHGEAAVTNAAIETLACIAPGASIFDNAGISALRRFWMDRSGTGITPLPPIAERAERRKLRIGYVSAYFGERNWMKPVFGVINQHDRERFEVHLISDGGDPDAASGYDDHAEDRIWRTAGMPNALLAERIRAAGLDVLVDLNGYSVLKRLPLFLYRPAPRQIAWFNAYATTGTNAFDCLIADAAALPAEEEAFYCEPVRRVPGSYLAFTVSYPVPAVTPPPCLMNGYLTFGCLASCYKLTDATVGAWAAILKATPSARLLIKNARLDDASNRDALLARCARHGLAPERLLLEGGEEHFRFLEAYGRIDVALDVFPYNGGTTTTEALWQGVPVLTFNGDRCASRTSRSLLLAAGLGDWIARDVGHYIDTAIRLATAGDTPARLAELRQTMRARLTTSPACDCAALCRALEELYVAA